MILFPRPRVLFLVALALAIPSWGASLFVFYLAFKRPYDKVARNAILALAKSSMEKRRAGQLVKVNRAAIEGVFSKFSDPAMTLKYGIGVPFVRWGILTHPMLNDGKPFTLRIDSNGGAINVEASPGEAWWLLTDQLWLGRRGTAPGLPANVRIKTGEEVEDQTFEDPENAAFCMLFMELAHRGEKIEVPSLSYGRLSDFAFDHKLGAEWFPDHMGMRFYVNLNGRDYWACADNLDPSKMDAGGVRLSAGH
ncbi:MULTISPECIES: hypothetical protein [unclassified Variovorax]|uniref:hypothetical protein n=1 Tax=unclassified Variovorax TaxID=663243 RepID=UPI00076DECD6|nr:MULTISPECIES: hypothetical protein [unclassified Variovorax]KWT70847.1 hypothetical protein APY03_6603 [Variovorax sp. WDL1]PNG49214.1 hypothetical protein CHC06_06451 [Variovorax sp. B2]PNG49599.1 hypothetical protein CHC07_06508 [Variovorax sp. B4]VTV18731.1 hypothetical protein WDL1P2_00389 [Variovorax sp. WDL1]